MTEREPARDVYQVVAEPVTKQDVETIVGAVVEASKLETLQRIDDNRLDLLERIDNGRIEMLERIEKTETTLLKEFRKWAAHMEASRRVHEA